jgi:hypothetical protein
MALIKTSGGEGSTNQFALKKKPRQGRGASSTQGLKGDNPAHATI